MTRAAACSIDWADRIIGVGNDGVRDAGTARALLLRVGLMDIRQLQYLAALAREKHFTRAAKACNVTQPTLSGRIRQLEQELGVPIVERGQRFHGLTPEGERVLKWAHAILDNWGSLQQEISKLRNTKGTLIGRLSLGVIPSGLPMAALLAKAIQERHPGIELTVLSQSSVEILRNLEEFSIDVGLSYLDNEPIEGMRAEAIYTEKYCLLVRADHELGATAAQAASTLRKNRKVAKHPPMGSQSSGSDEQHSGSL
jgi:DNA-binding transcriptional LysR family regulator